jgi:RNA polymerase sigma factor (sigma-70 family)
MQSAADREERILGLATQVVMLARRMARRVPVPFEELEAAGWHGAIAAVDRFNPSRAQLQTYAKRRIIGAMLDYCREIDPLSRKHRRDVKGSTHAPVNVELDSSFSDPERMQEVIHAERSVEVLTRRARLSNHQAFVIQRYYFEGVKSEDIAKELGVHQSRAGQLKTEALKRLRRVA